MLKKLLAFVVLLETTNQSFGQYFFVDWSTSDFSLDASGYTIAVIPSNALTGEQVEVSWTRPGSAISIFDWVAIFRAGASDRDYFDRRQTLFRFGETEFYFEIAGNFEARYFRSSIFHSQKVATSFFSVEEPVSHPERVKNYPPRTGSVIAFGDSITSGFGVPTEKNFVSLLSAEVSVPIQNAGKSGDTTALALTRLESDVLSKKPSVVLVCLGGNDSLQNVPIDTTFGNLSNIVGKIHGNGAVALLLGVPRSLGTDEYAPKFRELYEKSACAYVPNILRGVEGNIFLLGDLVHPDEEGHAVIADRVKEPLRRILSPIAPPRLALRKMGEQLQVSWPGKSGRIYNLMVAKGGCRDFASGTDLSGNDEPIAVIVDPAEPSMFFRVIEH